MFQQDFIMREIELIGRFYIKILFGKDTMEPPEEVRLDKISENYLFYQLRKLVEEGKINEAENLLFDEIKEEPKQDYLLAACEFYRMLSETDEMYLKRHAFSREEIMEGLSEVKQIYGIPE